MANSRNTLSRKGFSLIELLVVIGILAVLLGLAVAGFRGLEATSSDKKTKMILGNAASMLAEYDASTGLRRQPAHMWKNSPPVQHMGAFDFWKDGDPDTNGNQRLGLVGFVNEDADPVSGRMCAPVRNAAVVMGLISKSPTAQNVLKQLPEGSTMKVESRDTHGTVTVYEPTPVLADGWNNPLIFVPAAGLTVLVDGAQYVVTSSKTYPTTGAGNLPLGTVPDTARPFFASAGPDGNFSTGSDNVYSFQN